MPSGPFAHICLLVKDLDKAVEDWTKLLGVARPGAARAAVVRYEDFEGGEDQMRWATFVSAGGAEIQLMEPGARHAAGPPAGQARRGRPPHLLHDGQPGGHLAAAGRGGPDVRRGLQRPDDALAALDLGHPGLGARDAVEVARPYEAVDGTWESGPSRETVVVVGGGAMGNGIAQVVATAGLEVTWSTSTRRRSSARGAHRAQPGPLRQVRAADARTPTRRWRGSRPRRTWTAGGEAPTT